MLSIVSNVHRKKGQPFAQRENLEFLLKREIIHFLGLNPLFILFSFSNKKKPLFKPSCFKNVRKQIKSKWEIAIHVVCSKIGLKWVDSEQQQYQIRFNWYSFLK